LYYQLAAEKALRSFSDLPFPLSDNAQNESDLSSLTTATTTTTTITSTFNSTLNIDNDRINSNSTLTTETNDNLQRTTSSPNISEPREIQSGLSPLYLLNQLKRDAQYELIGDERSSPSSSTEQQEFKIAVIVDGQRFLGSGRSKRIAKTRAAQLALEKLFGMCFDKEGKTKEYQYRFIHFVFPFSQFE